MRIAVASRWPQRLPLAAFMSPSISRSVRVFARSIALHGDHDAGLLHLLPLKAARTAPVFHDKLRSDEKICYNYCQKNNS